MLRSTYWIYIPKIEAMLQPKAARPKIWACTYLSGARARALIYRLLCLRRGHVRAGATGASAPTEIWPWMRRTRPQMTSNLGEGPILVLLIVFDCKKDVIYSAIASRDHASFKR